jgi:putative flippase GtrA
LGVIPSSLLSPLTRQFSSFIVVGGIAAIVHYGTLIGMVEVLKVDPVPATLLGYIFGSLASYILNRRHTYKSEQPHGEVFWRFAVVAFSGFVVTGCLMFVFTKLLSFAYLPSQIVTTGIVLFWHFILHKLWTFRA